MYEVSSNTDSGRVIAFWSPIHRQGGTSATAAMVASALVDKLEPSEKILMLSNELYGAPTAGTYMQRDNMPDGLTEIIELTNSDNLKSPTDIYNNTFTCAGEKIDIVNSRKRNLTSLNDLTRAIPELFDMARQGYRYTIVDTVAGTKDESTMAILRHCDTIVVCLPQDKYIIDSWIRKVHGVYTKEVENKRAAIVLTMFYNYKHMSYATLRRQLKADLYYISLNDFVHKAICERSILEAITGTRKSKHPDDVIEELNMITQGILSNLSELVNDELLRVKEEEEIQRKETEDYMESLALFESAYEEEGDSAFEFTYGDDTDSDTGFGADGLSSDTTPSNDSNEGFSTGNEGFGASDGFGAGEGFGTDSDDEFGTDDSTGFGSSDDTSSWASDNDAGFGTMDITEDTEGTTNSILDKD